MTVKLFKAQAQPGGRYYYFCYLKERLLFDAYMYTSLFGLHVEDLIGSYKKEIDALENAALEGVPQVQLFLSNEAYRCKQWIEVDVSETPFEKTVYSYKAKLSAATECDA